MVGRVGGGIWVGIGLSVGKWQFSSNFLFAFANLLLGVVASISGSIFWLCFLGVGNLGLVRVGNGFRVGNFCNVSFLSVVISSLHLILMHLVVLGFLTGWVLGWGGVGFVVGNRLRVGNFLIFLLLVVFCCP